MAQDTSIEAARARIQRLVEEITALSRKEMRSEEYFQEYLTRVVQATDGKGGAVWLVAPRAGDGKSELQLAAQVELETSLFNSDEDQRAYLLKQIADTVQGKKPVVAPPAAALPEPGSLAAQMEQMRQEQSPALGNKSPFPIFHLPLALRDQVLGVLQVWLQPYVTQQNYGEFVTFLATLAQHVEQHFHSRRLGNLVLENQRLQQVLKFTSDVAGSLDPLEVARLSANYGRDLLGCDRCTVLSLRGDRWNVEAISGQETVEKKSTMVKALVAFVAGHAGHGAFERTDIDPATGIGATKKQVVVLSRKALLAPKHAPALPNGHVAPEPPSATPVTTEAAATPATPPANAPSPAEASVPKPAAPSVEETVLPPELAYLEHSHMASGVIAPIYDQDEELVGALFAESSTDGFFETPAGRDASQTHKMTEWLALHSGKALIAAKEYRSLPLLSVTSKMRNTHYALTGRKRGRYLFRAIIVGAILLGIALYPKMIQVDGNCSVMPQRRAAVVPEVGGRVERVFVREGSQVKKGDPIAQLDTKRLNLELEAARQEQFRALAEADRLRGLGEEAQAKLANLQAVVSEKNVAKLEMDIASATLRSPIDGVVLSKDLELHVGEFIQPGSGFAEVAALDDWELQVEVSEKKIGKLERELIDRGTSLPVNYILYSQSAHKLSGTLESMKQVSAMAYPREKEQVFIVTLPQISAPAELKGDFRPGLTGRAKVDLHREPLIVWFVKGCIDWVRLKWIH